MQSGRPGLHRCLRAVVATVASTVRICTVVRMTAMCRVATLVSNESTEGKRREAAMRSFGGTSTATSRSHLFEAGLPRVPAAWHETLAAVGVVLVGLMAFAFVLVVLPWVISI